MEDQTLAHAMIVYSSVHHDDNQSSDCESSVSTAPIKDQIRGYFDNNHLVRLDEKDSIFEAVKRRMVSNLGDLGNDTTIVAIHRKNWLGFRVGKAMLKCFGILAQAFAEERDGDITKVVKYAWYGGSKQDISKIMAFGFDQDHIHDHHSFELCLSPVERPAQSMQDCSADEDGLMHLLLCRVLLEDTEFTNHGATQSHSRSKEIDSEDQDEVNSPPRKYRFWNTKMNSHILPEYVVTFKPRPSPCMVATIQDEDQGMKKKPNSPWIPISVMIQVLSKFLPPPQLHLILNHHMDLKGKKISRREFVQKLREITGDDLLIKIIEGFHDKISSNKVI